MVQMGGILILPQNISAFQYFQRKYPILAQFCYFCAIIEIQPEIV